MRFGDDPIPIGRRLWLRGPGTKKLNVPEVVEVKRRIAAGDRLADIARDLGRSPGTLQSIKSGANWSTVFLPHFEGMKTGRDDSGVWVFTEDGGASS